MAKPSSYQLLKDIHDVTSKLEKKVDKRVTILEEKVDKNESKLNNMIGKAGIGLVVLSSIIGTAIALAVEWIKSKFA